MWVRGSSAGRYHLCLSQIRSSFIFFIVNCYKSGFLLCLPILGFIFVMHYFRKPMEAPFSAKLLTMWKSTIICRFFAPFAMVKALLTFFFHFNSWNLLEILPKFSRFSFYQLNIWVLVTFQNFYKNYVSLIFGNAADIYGKRESSRLNPLYQSTKNFRICPLQQKSSLLQWLGSDFCSL